MTTLKNSPRSLLLRFSPACALVPLKAEDVAPLVPLQQSFIESYLEHKDQLSEEEWLSFELNRQLPEIGAEEAAVMARELLDALRRLESKKLSLMNAVLHGRSAEDWLVSEVKVAKAPMDKEMTKDFLSKIHDFVRPKKSVITLLSRRATEEMMLSLAGQAGFNLAQKLWEGRKVKSADLLQVALNTGADLGIKAALAGAVKVGVEKGLLKFIPKSTSADVLASVVELAVDEAKILKKVALREISVREGFEQIELLTISASAGIILSTKTTAVGAVWGAVFGPMGAVLGGFIGGSLGFLAASQVAELGVKGLHRLLVAVYVLFRHIGSATFGVGKTVARALRRVEADESQKQKADKIAKKALAKVQKEQEKQKKVEKKAREAQEKEVVKEALRLKKHLEKAQKERVKAEAKLKAEEVKREEKKVKKEQKALEDAEKLVRKKAKEAAKREAKEAKAREKQEKEELKATLKKHALEQKIEQLEHSEEEARAEVQMLKRTFLLQTKADQDLEVVELGACLDEAVQAKKPAKSTKKNKEDQEIAALAGEKAKDTQGPEGKKHVKAKAKDERPDPEKV